MSVVEEIKPTAIVMSGFPKTCKPEGYIGVCEVLQKCEVPMICFCGSHQLIGGSLTCGLNQNIKPMRKISPDEDFPRVPKSATSDASQYFVAVGFFPIKRVKEDPIFTGLPELMIMKCNHYCELKSLPTDFEIIASSEH